MTNRRTPRSRSRRHVAAVVRVVSALAAGVVLAAAGASTASAEPVNAAPAVAPSLHQWSGGAGEFDLTSSSRIVVDTAHADALDADVRLFRDDLAAVDGLDLPIVVKDKPGKSDVFFTLGAAGLGPEGYVLTVSDHVVVDGGGTAGAFYGGRTILQILTTAPTHVSLPRGEARDRPDFPQRGVMLDTARKYYSVAYIERTIKQLAWLKMNTLHLHLTDSEAWRLESDTYPGLTAPQHYTKAQIREIQDLAHRYHVTIQAELEMPAHADSLTSYNPALRWSCPSMNDTPYGPDNGFTIDITKADNVAWVDRLVEEYLPLFDSPVIHLGGDEYPVSSQQQACPELVDYAAAHGFKSTEDVFVAYQNHLNDLVKRHGKTLMLWDWWDVAGGATTEPDKDVVIQAWRGNPSRFVDDGYQTVGSSSTEQYVVPNTPPGWVDYHQPDSVQQYSVWEPTPGPRMLGFQIPAWGDGAAGATDAYFDWFLHRPAQVLAARTWGGPRMSSVYSFEHLVDRIGAAPGVPDDRDPEAVKLDGTPYGNVTDKPDHTYAKAFDANVDTYVDTADPSGGYTGIDLGAGHASAVTEVRFVPRANEPGWGYVNRMIGGRFQGCTDGPAIGCHDLAKVPWRPTRDWNVLAVTDHTQYRWLRYIPPTDGFTNVAEIEFYTAPAATGRVRVSAPDTISRSGDTVVTTFTNTGAAPLKDVRLSLDGFAADTYEPISARASSPAETSSVPAGDTFSVSWQVDVPADAKPGEVRVVGHVRYAAPKTDGVVNVDDLARTDLQDG
ncbi:MAG TPA: family 20 glycosylhydrolase [Streptosporangiales bacterium]